MKTHALFLVEDHPAVRHAYTSLILREPDLVLCGEATSARDALQQIPDSGAEVVLIDISLQDASGIALIEELHRLYPYLSILVVSGLDELLYAQLALDAGACGYLMKDNIAQLLTAIRQVLQGELYLSERASAVIS